jgi:hypothetical protein
MAMLWPSGLYRGNEVWLRVQAATQEGLPQRHLPAEG